MTEAASDTPMAEPGAREGRLRRAWLLPVLLALVATGAYLNTLSAGFTFDDRWLILDNPRIADPTYISYMLFERPLWRPVKRITLMLDHAVWGREHATGYHATNLALNTAACLALYALFRRIGARDRVAFLGTLLFALHPVHVEAVANISHRKESLALLFQALAFLAYLKARAEPAPASLGRALLTRLGRADGGGAAALARVEWGALSGALFLLALLSKEVGAVMLPAVILLYEVALREGSIRRRLRIVGAALAANALALGLLLLKGQLGNPLRRFSPAEIDWLTGHQTSSYAEFLLRVPKVLWSSVAILLWPTPLYLDRAFTAPSGLTDPTVLGGLLLVVLYGIALTASWRSSRLAFFALGWCGLQWLPVSNIIPLTQWPFAERFLYIPSAGFTLLVALGLDALLAGRPLALGAPGAARGLGVLLTLLLAGGYAAKTIRQNEVWRSNQTLWSHTLEHNPRSFRGLFVLGRERIDARDLPGAERLFERCVEANRFYSPCRQSLHLTLIMQGRIPEALKRATEHQEQNPGDASAWASLGRVRLLMGDRPGADQAYRSALELDPKHQDALQNLAHLSLTERRDTEAVELAERALRKEASVDTQRIHAQALARLGRTDEAIASYRRLLKLDARAPGAAAALAPLLVEQGKVGEAIEVLQRAVALDPTRKSESALLEKLKSGAR